MSNIELHVLRKRAIDGNKRLRRLVPLVTAAALGTSLIAGAARPASAAVRQPARTAPISLASSGNALPAVSLATAARYVHVSDGRFAIDAGKAGVSSQAPSTESTLVASLTKLPAADAIAVMSVTIWLAVGQVPACATPADSTVVPVPPAVTTGSASGY